MRFPRTDSLLAVSLLALFSCAYIPSSQSINTPPLPAPDYKEQKENSNLSAAKEAFVSGDLEKAREFAEKTTAIDPYNADARDILAWYYDLAGETEKALQQRLWRLRVIRDDAEIAVMETLLLPYSRSENKKLALLLFSLLEQNPPEPLRGKILIALAQIERKLGRLKMAEQHYNMFDYIPAYWTLGALDNDQNSGFNTSLEPEREFIPDKEYQGKRWKIKWRWLDTPDFDGRIHFVNHIDPISWALVYAYAQVESPRDMDATLRVSAENHIKLWFNGGLVLSNDQTRFGSVDQFVVPIKLKKGKNFILAKVAQRQGDWLLGIRVTAPDGSKIAGLKYPIKPLEAYPPAAQEETITLPRFEYARGYGLYEPSGKDDPIVRFRKAYWLQLCGYIREAIDAYEQLNDDYPAFIYANYQLADAYRSEDNKAKAVSLYKEMLKLKDGKLPLFELEMAFYYRSQGREDRSYDYIKELLKNNPRYLAARKALVDYFSDKGFIEEAVKAAEALYQEFPDRADIAETLAFIYESLGYTDKAQKSYEAALALDPTRSRSRNALVKITMNRQAFDEAISLHKAALNYYPYQVNQLLDIAEIYMREEDYESAGKMVDKAIKISPDYWKNYELKGKMLLRKGDKSGAVEYFRKALAYRPSDTQLREYLEHLSPEEDKFFLEYRTKREEAERIIEEARKNPKFSDEPAYVLLDYGIAKIFPNGSSKEYVHQIIQINSQSGQQRFNKIRIPGSYSLKLYNALSYTPDGEELEATSIKSNEIHFPSFEKGTIIEIEYLWEKSSGGWLDEHYSGSFYFQDTIPVRLSRWVVALPKDKKLLWEATGDLIKMTSSEFEDNAVYDFYAENVPKIEEEDMRPPLFDLLARVDISTIHDWNILTRWMNTLVNDQAIINNAIRRKVKELADDKATKLEKLIAIYKFIVTDIRYLFADEGIMGKKPDLPANIFDNRFGDCKDKTLLMIAMLKEVGIEARYAELRTREKGKISVKIPSATTNHAIVYIPKQEGLEKEMFIDGTATNFSHDTLPYSDQGVDIIVLNGKEHEFMRTPLMPPEKDNVKIEFTHTIAENGDAKTAATITAVGAAAAVYRARFKDEAVRRKRIEDWLSYYFKGSELKEYEVAGLEDIEAPIVLKMNFSAPSFARVDGKEILVKVPNPTNLARTYAKTQTRLYDLVLGKMGIFENRHTFILPEKYKLSALPAPVNEKAKKYYEFAAEYSAHKNQFTLDYTYTQKSIELPPADYEDFKSFCLKIEEVERKEFKFVKK